jgi:hypothetical protein
MGYDDKSKVYKLYHPKKKNIILSRDITFEKSKIRYKYLNKDVVVSKKLFPQGMWESLGGEASILPNDIIQKEGDLESTPVADRQPSTLELASIANLIDPKPPPDVADRQLSISTPQDPVPQVIRYPTRERRRSSRFRDNHVFVVEDEEIIINEELKTYVEAM